MAINDDMGARRPVSTLSHSPARRHRRYLSSEQIDQLAADYQAGSSTKDLGAEYGIHRNTVSTLLKRRGLPLRYRRLEPKDVDLAIELYRTGL